MGCVICNWWKLKVSCSNLCFSFFCGVDVACPGCCLSQNRGQGCDKQTEGERHMWKKGWGKLCTQNGFLPVFGPCHLSFPEWGKQSSPRGRGGTVGWLAWLQFSWLPGEVHEGTNSEIHFFSSSTTFLVFPAKYELRFGSGRCVKRALDRIPSVGARWRRGIMLRPFTWVFWGKPR